MHIETGGNMRTRLTIGVSLLYALVVFASPGTHAAGNAAEKPKTKTVVIPIKGMACQEMCGTKVLRTLQAIDGVAKVNVSAASGNARVTYVEAKVKPHQLVDAIKKLGFEASVPK
jgi:copper chaperone CopZ